MAVACILLGKVAGHLRQRFVGCKSDAHRHANVALDLLVKCFAPCFQILMLHAVQINKALIDAVTEVGWHLLADDRHHTACQLSVELIV